MRHRMKHIKCRASKSILFETLVFIFLMYASNDNVYG